VTRFLALSGLLVAAVAVVIAGPWALLYIVLYGLATVPGWPIGQALFGRHPAAWVTGALAGYGLTALTLWAVIAIGFPGAITFSLAWALCTAMSWLLLRHRGPFIELPAVPARDLRALILLVWLVPAVFVLPYKNLGARDIWGDRFYRAYFTADFFLHTALAAELTKYDMPPQTPYGGGGTLQYYWSYFLLPAVVAQEGPSGLAEVETCLKVNAYCSAVLFLSMLVLATWTASGSIAGVVLAILVAVLAASAEGLFAIRQLAAGNRPLTELTDLNIDAITAWEFKGLRIDSLVRTMWYNPQHSISAACGLVSWISAGTAGVRAPIGAVALTGTLLALSTIFNPFVGGLFSLIYGIAITFDAIRERRPLLLARQTIAAVLVALAVVYCIANGMVEGAGGAVLFGFGGFARNRPIATLLWSLGPLLLPAILCVWSLASMPRGLVPAFAGTIVALVCFFYVRLSVEGSYIGFRAGHLLQMALPAFAAIFFARIWRRWRTVAIGVAVVLLAIGLPTTVIDIYNTQDIRNMRMGPGLFRWTVMVTRDEQQAFNWIRTQTPKDAIVQMDPVAHGRETWSQVPTFAWRRMAASQSIVPPMMSADEFEQRWRRAHEIFAEGRADVAWRLARELNIDYLFVGPAERRLNPPEALEKFAERSDLFAQVFTNRTTKVYRVVK
jgi:hypothetical protein